MGDRAKQFTRNPNIDLVKSVAVFCVIGVHFFLNSGFYDASLDRILGLIGTTVRTALMVCVPLFLITTGYLMKNKTLEKSYYLGVLRTLTIYIVASLFCFVWRIGYFGQEYSFADLVAGILDYSTCSYAWYIEMYLGLYLLIPFLNALYQALETKARRLALLGTLFFIVALPPMLNIYIDVAPEWWSANLYPILYYYIGSYIRDYPVRKPALNLTALFLLCVSVSSLINYFVSISAEPDVFVRSGFTSWQSMENVLTSSILFTLLMQVKFTSSNSSVSRLFSRISSASLAIYLVSWIVDKSVYPLLSDSIGSFYSLFPLFPLVVPSVFLVSFFLAIMVTKLSECCSTVMERHIRRVFKLEH